MQQTIRVPVLCTVQRAAHSIAGQAEIPAYEHLAGDAPAAKKRQVAGSSAAASLGRPWPP